ncbi:hypothetical protein HDV00_010336 [Rhizophlyctis rosea]|nr:hypothetical protein HDV00_010336 [Rhizophlyctis rosea]
MGIKYQKFNVIPSEKILLISKPNNGTEDARHGSKKLETYIKNNKKLAKIDPARMRALKAELARRKAREEAMEGRPRGTYHFGICKIQIANAGYWINVHKEGKIANMQYNRAMINLLAGAGFQGLSWVMGQGLGALDKRFGTDMLATCRKQFDNLPQQMRRFWEFKANGNNKWCPFFILVDDMESNQHKDALDAPNCLCGLVGLGEWTGNVCLDELGVSVPFQQGDVLYLRSSHLSHSVNGVEGRKRFMGVFAVHEKIYEDTWRYEKEGRAEQYDASLDADDSVGLDFSRYRGEEKEGREERFHLSPDADADDSVGLDLSGYRSD